MPSGPKSNRLLANFFYATATCMMGGVGWFAWSSMNRPPTPAIPVVEAQSGPSLDDQLRSSDSSAATPPTVVTPLPTQRPAPVTTTNNHKPTRANPHVRGGITIVGPAGTTSTVAPATKNDLGAPTAEPAPTTSTLLSAPAASPSPATPPPPSTGPRLYTAPAPTGASANSSPSGALRFYNFDAQTPTAIQRLNKGEAASKWEKRVTYHPFD